MEQCLCKRQHQQQCLNKLTVIVSIFVSHTCSRNELLVVLVLCNHNSNVKLVLSVSYIVTTLYWLLVWLLMLASSTQQHQLIYYSSLSRDLLIDSEQ